MSASLLAVFVSAIVLLAGFGAGHLLRRLWTEAESREQRAESSRQTSSSAPQLLSFSATLISTLLGLGFLSYLIFLFGILGLLGAIWPSILIGLIVVLAVYAGVVIVRALLARPKKQEATSQKARSGKRQAEMAAPAAATSIETWIVLAVCAITGIAVLICALAPSAMDDWDSLAYHLTLPRLYLEHGGIYHITTFSHSNFPLLEEMLFLPGVALGLPVAAKLMHFWYGVMLVGSVALLAKRRFGRDAGALAAVGVISIPMILWEATTAYNDLATAAYTVLAIYFVTEYLESRSAKTLVGCGLACGFAAATKMTGLSVLGIAVMWLVVDGIASGKQRAESGEQRAEGGGEDAVPSRLLGSSASQLLKAVLTIVLIGIAACFPWYLRAWIYTGNPVYPFFYSIFGGRDWTPELAKIYSNSQAHFGTGHTLISLLRLPYDLMVSPERFYDTPGLYVGPIMLAIVPFALLVIRRRNRALLGLVGCFVAFLAVWFVLTHQSRYLIPALVLGSALIAGVCAANRDIRVLKIAAYAVFIGGLAIGWFSGSPMSLGVMLAKRWPVVSGAQTQHEYLRHSLDIYLAEDYINRYSPRQTRVALFGDTRAFYLEKPFDWCDYGHNTQFSRKFSDGDELITELAINGNTHVMVNTAFLPKDGNTPALLDAINRGKLKQVFPNTPDYGRVRVYELAR